MLLFIVVLTSLTTGVGPRSDHTIIMKDVGSIIVLFFDLSTSVNPTAEAAVLSFGTLNATTGCVGSIWRRDMNVDVLSRVTSIWLKAWMTWLGWTRSCSLYARDVRACVSCSWPISAEAAPRSTRYGTR